MLLLVTMKDGVVWWSTPTEEGLKPEHVSDDGVWTEWESINLKDLVDKIQDMPETE